MRICVKRYEAVEREGETGGERAGQRREESEGGQHKEQNKVISRYMTKNTLKDHEIKWVPWRSASSA